MDDLELNGTLFLVREQRPLARDNRDDRLLIASEVIAVFERQGWQFVLPTRAYHVACLRKSVPFVRLICGSVVSGFVLAAAAEIPTAGLPPGEGYVQACQP